jgi:hypothetical protein
LGVVEFDFDPEAAADPDTDAVFEVPEELAVAATIFS